MQDVGLAPATVRRLSRVGPYDAQVMACVRTAREQREREMARQIMLLEWLKQRVTPPRVRE